MTSYTYTITIPNSNPAPTAPGCIDGAMGSFCVAQSNGTDYPPVSTTTETAVFVAGDTITFSLPTSPSELSVKIGFVVNGGGTTVPFTYQNNGTATPITSGLEITQGMVFTTIASPPNATLRMWFNLASGTNTWLVPDPEVQTGTGS